MQISGVPGISGSGGGFQAGGSVIPQSETLVQLCRFWGHIHSSPPPEPPVFCPQILKAFYGSGTALLDDRLLDSSRKHVGLGGRMVGIDNLDELTFTGRSLSLMGVLGGVLFILLIIAFVTCIKHRKRLRDVEGNHLNLDIISSQIRQLNQARASQHLLSMLGSLPELPPAPPPDYDTVLKETQREEQDLPSYSQAIGGLDTICEEEVCRETNP